MKILAIESSCDDTAAAVWANGQIVSNVVSSQLVHEQYGGVVPEVASRAHNESIYSVVEAALETAETDLGDLDAIACTQGPGLMGSLLVGFTFAKSLAQGLAVPFIGVHHMRAHILAHFIEEPKPDFPFLCLTVSGGHTQLVKCLDPLDMKIIGSTLDDAAGEAFDKIGKMLGLPYPAGPALDQLAQKGDPIFDFPEPQIPGLDFSFSGLKTSVLYFLRSNLNKNPDFIELHKNDLCSSVQERIVSILLNKLTKAAHETDIQHIGIAGGVSANSALRKELAVKSSIKGWHVFLPKLTYCTDNAAMVAMAGYFMYQRGQFSAADARPDPRLKW